MLVKIGVFVILIFVLVSACEGDKKKAQAFVDYPAKMDETCTWLMGKENFGKAEYILKLKEYYFQKIKISDLNSARKALEIMSKKVIFSFNFKSEFTELIDDFDEHYRDKFPIQKTTFVDSYYGNYYFDKGDFNKSNAYFRAICKIPPNDYTSCYNRARAHYDLAYNYFSTGNLKQSLEANRKALKYYEMIDHEEGRGSVFLNYANIYKVTGDYKRAHFNLDKGIACFKKVNNQYDMYMGLYNKISIYDYADDPKMYPLIDSSYQLLKNSNYKNDVLKIALYDFKIENLLRANQLDEAKELIEELKPVSKRLNSQLWLEDYKATVAQYNLKKNPDNFDLQSLIDAVPVFMENEQFEKAQLFTGVLKKHAVAAKDYKNALKYEESLKEIAQQIASKSARNKVLELDRKYHTKSKEQQIIIQKKTIKNKNTYIVLLITILIGLLFLLFAFFSFQKQKKLKKERLNALQYAKKLIEKTEEERKRIASDLHDSVSHDLLNLKNSSDIISPDSKLRIDSIINEIRVISRNLHPVMFDKIGLKASVEQLIERTQFNYNFMISSEINYIHKFKVNDELQIYRIIQEALTNIIKYSNAFAARIIIEEQKKWIYIEIKDNGSGFDVSNKLHFSDAFGLHNIIERSKSIGGEPKITSDKNGTIITIKIAK